MMVNILLLLGLVTMMPVIYSFPYGSPLRPWQSRSGSASFRKHTPLDYKHIAEPLTDHLVKRTLDYGILRWKYCNHEGSLCKADIIPHASGALPDVTLEYGTSREDPQVCVRITSAFLVPSQKFAVIKGTLADDNPENLLEHVQNSIGQSMTSYLTITGKIGGNYLPTLHLEGVRKGCTNIQ